MIVIWEQTEYGKLMSKKKTNKPCCAFFALKKYPWFLSHWVDYMVEFIGPSRYNVRASWGGMFPNSYRNSLLKYWGRNDWSMSTGR